MPLIAIACLAGGCGFCESGDIHEEDLESGVLMLRKGYLPDGSTWRSTGLLQKIIDHHTMTTDNSWSGHPLFQILLGQKEIGLIEGHGSAFELSLITRK